MLINLYSMLIGFIVGVIYSYLFLKSFDIRSNAAERFDFKQALTFVARFIFIITVVVTLIIYSNISILGFLFGFGGAFWGTILLKLRKRK